MVNVLAFVVLGLSLLGNALLLRLLHRWRRQVEALAARPEQVRVEVREVVREVPVEVPGPERVVRVPGPERLVEVPGPERVVQVPGPERVVRVDVPGPERVVRVGAVSQFGAGPFPTGVPGGLALGRDSVPDTVVDGADLGSLRVRGTSQRGGRNRADQRFRRDAFLTRILPEFPRPTLLSAVSAGHPLGRWSQAAAGLLCESLATQLGAFAKPLESALASDESAEAVTDLLRTAIRGTAGSLERLAHRHQAEAEDVSADVLAVLTPLGQTSVRRHLVLGTGSGVALLLRDRSWHPVLELGPDTAWTTARALPSGCELRRQSVATRPGDTLVLCTGATAELVRSPEVAKFLAETWRPGAADLLGFLQQTAFRTTGGDTDRTLVCLWEAF
ncbi:protein phosphatase 2C domain-containing protein [Streptomyces sp. NPDC059582]|uniref:protein phosphatase 2C domain-containing protein n=1 Tax=Streptomyces sp. NPDC059582 TaxID=3346875 RepID=UPI0036923357